MSQSSQLLPPILRSLPGTVFRLTIFCVLPLLAARPAQTQTFSVIHTFTGGSDGAMPYASLTFGGAGTLYGTTRAGGVNDCDGFGCGVVFKMTQHNGAWLLAPLYAFTRFSGSQPYAPVAFGPNQLLYGTTRFGGTFSPGCGGNEGCGLVFTLQPTPTACHAALCSWIDNSIYEFASGSDGEQPEGSLAFDQAGNVYGTTIEGGDPCNGGQVFQLARSGQSWTKTTVYNFLCGTDGAFPTGVIIDPFGNLFGVAGADGAYRYGAIFEVMPSGSGWTETLIHSFQNGSDGAFPNGGLVMDAEGNLYGATGGGGVHQGGTVFELSPSGGGWTFSVLASLPPNVVNGGGQGATGSPALDSAGNLYETTYDGGAFGCGSVFKLAHSGGQWTYIDLHDFNCGDDGGYPVAGPTLDSSGNLYGTTSNDGSLREGVVWEITP